MFKIVFENRAVYEIMGKRYGRARQATDGTIIRRRIDAICHLHAG